jgi:cytochrome P450
LDAVLCETLRLFPPAPAVERKASQDYLLGDSKIKVPKDTFIHISTYTLHRDPDQFTDPEKFLPERFFPENRTHHPYAYLPFGAGPRNCLGMRLALMEAKLALMNVVYNFKFTVSPKTKVNIQYY